MGNPILREKSFLFAVNAVLFAQEMIKSHEYILSRQLIRSATSIGALIREAQFAESRADYLHKFMVALKEANETKYWLDLICKTYPQWKAKAMELKQPCNELIAMLVSTTRTLKENLQPKK